MFGVGLFELTVWAPNAALGLFRCILGTLNGTYRVCSRHMRIPGSRAHTRYPGPMVSTFGPRGLTDCVGFRGEGLGIRVSPGKCPPPNETGILIK